MKKAWSGVEWTCDGCGSTQLLAKGEEPAGLHGSLAYAIDGKAGKVEVVACSLRCVRPAMDTVMDRADRGDDVGDGD